MLRQALDSAGRPLPVHVAHRYLPGHAACVVDEILASGADAILALPLYPQFSYATSGSSFQHPKMTSTYSRKRARACVMSAPMPLNSSA